MEIGVDIVEIHRVRQAIRRTPGFLERVFTEEEIAYCGGHRDPWPHYAARFAAKEAVWKTIDKDGVGLKDISVKSDARGKPLVLLKGKPARGLRISLSHSEDYAVAVALKG